MTQFDASAPIDGVCIGQSSTDKRAFFGASPIVRPSGAAQAALSRANASGVIATWESTQSPSAVAQGTSAEQSLTIQAGTGGQMLIAANDVMIVNKPTSQAGLGVGNVRAAGANSLGINYTNIPAAGGNITPTASQAYKVLGLRGMSPISATLSPAAVAANTAVEQTFTVPTLPAGALVVVNKPTAQAGLDIGGARVVSEGVLGITFTNATASPITPTASEAYLVLPLFGLDAISNEINYGFHVGTVGAIGAGLVVSGGATTLTGMLATDMIRGISKPTPQAAATNATAPVEGIPAADTMTLYFLSAGSGLTPTPSEVYGISTTRINPAAPLKLYSQSLAPTSVAAQTTAEQTFTVTGLVAGSLVHVNKPSAQAGLAIMGVRVSAADTLAITYANFSASAIVPATEVYTIGNFQVKSPAANNVVWQMASPFFAAMGTLLNAIRAALQPTSGLGLIAGA